MAEIQIPYSPRPGQKNLHDLMEKFRFVVCVCHRGWGKTTGAINETISAALFSPLPRPKSAYICPFRTQAKANCWEPLKYFAGAVPGTTFNETELHADFAPEFGGGRVTLVGSDNADSIRGTHLDLAVLDEFGMMEPRVWGEIVRPTLSVRSGKALFVGTPFGKNHFFQLFEQAGALPDEWARIIFRADESGVLTNEELESARRTMTAEQFDQEYLCSWTSVADGSIYGKLLDAAERAGRIGDVPWQPGQPVDTAWDLGIGDSTAIWFIQSQRGGARRAIDYYEASGVGLSHYAKILKEKDYLYGSHIAPHDIEVQELGTGKTRKEIARELGIRFDVAPKLSIDEGIDAVRRLLPQMWIDRTRCARGLEALQSYRRQWDERLRMFTQKPLHDWASHSCDALRTFATGYVEPSYDGSGEGPSEQETYFDVWS